MLALASHELHFSILREVCEFILLVDKCSSKVFEIIGFRIFCWLNQDVLRQIQPENCIPLTKELFKTEETRKCRGWFPRATETTTRGKFLKKPYQVCSSDEVIWPFHVNFFITPSSFSFWTYGFWESTWSLIWRYQTQLSKRILRGL